MTDVLLCADASPIIGSGHMRRLLTLAEALARAGARPTLSINVEGADALASALSGSGLAIGARPPGVPAMATAARGHPEAEWVVLDTYEANADAEADFAALRARLAVIDDLADRPHVCDLLIDQNAHHSEADYRAVSPGARMLRVGAPYAMLKPSFARLRPAQPAQARLTRVFLSFGGFDPLSLLPASLDALLAHPEISVTVACGSQAPTAGRLHDQAKAAGDRVRLLLDADDLADEMAACQASVGAGGTMVWERACLGLPSLVLVVADNQAGVSEWLSGQGLANVLDVRRGLTHGLLTCAIDAFLADDDARLAQAAAAHALIDGRGAERVAAALLNGS